MTDWELNDSQLAQLRAGELRLTLLTVHSRIQEIPDVELGELGKRVGLELLRRMESTNGKIPGGATVPG